MPSGNEYLDFLNEQEQGQVARIGAAGTLTFGTAPDAAAKARQTAGQLGVAPAVVEATPQQSELQAQLQRIDNDTARTPTLRRRYTDADFHKLARDDSGVLAGVERVVRDMLAPRGRKPAVPIDPVMSSVQFSDTVRRMVEANPALDLDTARQMVLQQTRIDNGPLIGAIRQPMPTASSITRSLFSLDRLRATSAGLSVLSADVLGLDPARAQREFDVLQTRIDNRRPQFETETASAIFGGAESLVNNAPGIVLSVLSGNPAPGLALAGGQVGGEAYGKYRGRGATPGQAALGAGLEAGTEVLTELLPMSFLVKKMGKAGAGDFLQGLLAREIPGEQLATVVQDAVDTAIANPDKSWGEYLRERPGAAYQTLVATLVQSGALGAINTGVQKMAPQQEQAARADEVAQGVEQLAQLQAASKLAQRDPAEFVRFMRDLGEDGVVPTELYVDSQVLAQTLLQSGVPPQQLQEAAPQILQQLEKAAPGADVRAPVAELAALGPTFTQPLLDHLRESPEAMSRAEAQQFMKDQGDLIKREVERELAQETEAAAFKQQVEQATAQFEQELKTAGRFRDEVNKAYATLLGNFYAVQALRAGVPLQEMLERYQLQVRSQAPGGGRRLEQADVNSPEFQQWFGDSNLRNADGSPKVLFRGTTADEKKLRAAKTGLTGAGLYMGLNAEVAEEYAHGKGANIMPLFVRGKFLTLQEWTRYVNAATVARDPASRSPTKEDWAAARKQAEVDGFAGVIDEQFEDAVNVWDPKNVRSAISGQQLAQGERGALSPGGGHRLAQGPESGFRRWFGNSVVADGQGQPRVVYHGTNKTERGEAFTMFDAYSSNYGLFGQGAYFTENSEVASSYTTKGRGDAPTVYPVYLKIENPIDMDAKANPIAWERAFEDVDFEAFPPQGDTNEAHYRAVEEHFHDLEYEKFEAAEAIQDGLRKMGFDGITHIGGGRVKSDGVRHRVYIAFDPEQVKSATGNDGTFDADDPNILSQTDRGALSFAEDITAAPSVIALLEGADLSTFIHESGHFFLEVQADLAARIQTRISAGEQVGEGEQQIVTDFQKILAWFGVPDLDTWVQMSLEEKREHHEKWARGFERFAMEGKAPSLELQHLFARFRAWLVQVYRTLAGLNVELTDDVRQVMGRLLASDQAIAEAHAARNMGPLFQSPEQAGMTLEEYADYQRLAERATAQASAKLDARMLRDMKWLSRARDKALKEAQAAAKEARAEVEREVRAEVMAEPIYRAWAFLTGKQQRLAPGTVAPENMDGTLSSGRLRTTLTKALDAEAWARLSRLGMTSEEWGMDPDIVAELFGFASGEQLVRTLKITPEPAKVIEELTDFRTLQRHGDIASPEALNRAADEAVHNELRARVIANELKALAKANKVTETGDSLHKQRDVVDVLARAAEEYAGQVVARQKIRHLKPQQYAAAEARSAKLAGQALGKSTEEAAMHKRNQLVNNYAAKAAYAAQAEVRKGAEFFRKVMRGARDDIVKTRDWDMVQAARAILADYGMGPKGEAAQKYLEAVAQYDPETARILQERVATLTANAKPLRELTVEEFRGLEEEIRALWHMAKRSRQVEIDGHLIDIESAKIPLVQRMEAIGIPDRVPGEGKAVTDAERRIAKLRSAAAALRRVESWADAKDGSTPGPFRKFIWQPVRDAADRYRTDRAKFLRRYVDLLAGLDVGRVRIEAPELSYTFGYSRGGSGKAEILHALLHTGNASNKRKLLLGRKWAVERPDGTLDTTKWDGFVQRMIDQGVLTRRDFEFAQGVWDLLEETKPLAQKAHRDVFGRYFDEVTAEPFTNQFGTWRGGYVPAMADSEVVKDAATRSLMEDENQSLAFAFPSTNRGFTKSRVEYNVPLLLDLRILAGHIDKVLMFSHLEQPIREVRRILTSKAVSQPLHRLDPAAFDSLLTPWLNRAARQQVETRVAGDNGLMRFFSKLRSRAGMAAMFANVVNTAQQITGLSIAAVKVQPWHLRSALADWVVAPRQFARAVAEASPYMATRMDNEVAQMNGAIDDILLNPSVYERAQAWTAKHAYFMQSAVDNVIGPIVWTGAYNQALEAGHSEPDARRLADAAVRQTQGSTMPEDVSRIETGNAFVRLFTQFAGYFNMQANLLGTEFANLMHEQGLRRGMGRGLYVFTFGFLAPALVSELIVQAARGGPDDDDHDGALDDWLTSLFLGTMRSALAMIPVVGQVSNALINASNNKPYDDRISTAPAISMIEAAVRAPMEVYKAVADDGNQRRAVRDLATLISLTTGLPATAVARPAGYAADVGQGKVHPTGPLDATRGAVTGVASPESKR